jgi:protein-disulfide isomerase
MFASFRVLAAVAIAGLACKGADAARHESASSPASAPAPATTAAARSSAAMLTDSVSAHADSGRIRGNRQGAMWIVEASDFQCPYCKMWHDSTYHGLIRDYVETGKVTLAYLNFPLRQHQNAMPAAEAAMCASVQNKFWPMHDALFQSQTSWETLPSALAFFDSTAARLGVVMPAWRDCVSRHLTRPLIESDYGRSQSAGVKSTPTFFIGDEKVEGFAPYSYFRQVIEAQLAKKGASR